MLTSVDVCDTNSEVGGKGIKLVVGGRVASTVL